MGSTNQVLFLHTKCPIILVFLKRRRSPSPPASLSHGSGKTVPLVASTTLSCKEGNVYSLVVAWFFFFPLYLFFFSVDIITRSLSLWRGESLSESVARRRMTLHSLRAGA